MELSKEQKQALLNEKNSPTAYICCEDHSFYPGRITSMPMIEGCKYCILAQFYYDFAKTPPHLRQERLDELEALVNHMVESLVRGDFDVQIYNTPIINIEHEP